MLYREHVCIEIGNPLLALLRDSKVSQGIADIRPSKPNRTFGKVRIYVASLAKQFAGVDMAVASDLVKLPGALPHQIPSRDIAGVPAATLGTLH